MSVPIFNASGCLDALVAPDVALLLDAYVTKTVTPLQREGNEPPRFAELEHGMLNSIGLQNPGIDSFVAEHLPALERLETPVWVSVGGFSARDFAHVCERLEPYRAVETVELNLSCPNVDEAPETAAEIVRAARAVTGKTLYAKLSPATWDIGELARTVADAGADGLSLVNTMRGLAFDPASSVPRLGRGVGGYSGPALLPIATACIHACAEAVELPIVGMGGVASGVDALTLVNAGASAVAVGTALFADPFAPARIRAELEAELRARGLATSPFPHAVTRSSASAEMSSAVRTT